jgi:hypothetical protein
MKPLDPTQHPMSVIESALPLCSLLRKILPKEPVLLVSLTSEYLDKTLKHVLSSDQSVSEEAH